MPELPEIQTTIIGLQSLANKEITDIKLYSRKLRYLIPKNIIKILKNTKILKIHRIGKYIICELDNNYSLIFHFGMSGRFQISKIDNYLPIKHDHILIFFSSNKVLSYNDPRKFGFVDLIASKEVYKKTYISKLGLDPFDKKLTNNYLFEKIRFSSVPIKQILLDQRIIAGIGNIYASEILYDAKISPFIQGSCLDIVSLKRLIKSIRKILIKAIESGGTSIRNYISTDGTLGNFQNKFKVYGKENKNILGCKIKRVVQYGRSTFYCPEIQIIN